MNYIRSKSRNSMSLETADKLQFVYINIRTLRKLTRTEELLAMENELFNGSLVGAIQGFGRVYWIEKRYREAFSPVRGGH